MKKLFYIILCILINPLGYAQSVTIVPSGSTQLEVRGNVDGTTGTITGYLSTRTSYRDLTLRALSSHPLSFATGGSTHMRLNPGGDLGVGNAIALTTWDGDVSSSNNNILSKLHSYGIGSKEFSGPLYIPYKTAILGQAVGAASSHDRAGILGVTDGKATSGYYNVGVASIATSDPAATGSTYNFKGYNSVTSNINAYGSRNEVHSTGSGTNYGNYNSVNTSGTSNIYGTYNSTSTSNSVTDNTSYGVFNDLDGNRTLRGIDNSITKTGSGLSPIYGINTEITINSNSSTTYGERIEITNPVSNGASMYGIRSEVINENNSSVSYGVLGTVTGSGNGPKYGVVASAVGSTGPRYGIHASGATFAGYFVGNVHVSGTFSKSSGSFKIDHPKDPENKYLVHSFVESPDMMNIYNGNVTTDASGNATVHLPGYFDALNKDFRYQLTSIGQKADTWVAEEISGTSFKISSDKPNVKISWQVTGVRQDAYANANRIIPEIDKTSNEKGKYLNPEVFNKPLTAGIDAMHREVEVGKVSQKHHKEAESRRDNTIKEVILPKENKSEEK